MSDKYYLSEHVFVDFEKGIKRNCFSFLPSIMYVNYRQNTWASETCSFVFLWLCFYFQINKTKVNRDLSYSLTQSVMETINEILLNNDYYIKDDRRLRTVLSETDARELVLLCKNIPTHPYLNKIVMSTLLHHSDCVEKKVSAAGVRNGTRTNQESKVA